MTLAQIFLVMIWPLIEILRSLAFCLHRAFDVINSVTGRLLMIMDGDTLSSQDYPVQYKGNKLLSVKCAVMIHFHDAIVYCVVI